MIRVGFSCTPWIGVAQTPLCAILEARGGSNPPSSPLEVAMDSLDLIFL